MSMLLNRRGILPGLGLLLAGTRPASAQDARDTVVLASTTSVENSGLLAHLLPLFTAQTGIGVHVLALGTG